MPNNSLQWLGREIRTSAWRNQKPPEIIDLYSISAAMLHRCRVKKADEIRHLTRGVLMTV
jgi:hypothetical protein